MIPPSKTPFFPPMSRRAAETLPAAAAAAIRRRLHANPQSKGNLGKSLETEFRVAWLDRHRVPWVGSDLDDRHGTFSGRHPGEVKTYKLGNEAEAKAAFLALFRGVLREATASERDAAAPASAVAVHVLDTRAQADALFMAAVEELNFFELCAEEGIRPTFFLFPSDETESMVNFARLVRFGGDAVDFVVVENPTRNRAELYRGSRLEAALARAGAKTLTPPTLTPMTLLAIERAEAKAGRGLSFAELAAPEAGHLERILAGELQWALTRMFEQYDAIAELLLPGELAARVKAKAGRGGGGNREARNRPSQDDLGLNFGE